MSLRSIVFFALPLAAMAEEPSGLLSRVNEEQLVMAGKLQAEVEHSLATARRFMMQNPSQAEQDLKLALEAIDRAPEIGPETRAQVRRDLQTAIRAARAKKIELDERQAQANEREAAAREQQRLMAHSQSQQEKIKQLVDRFNALLEESRYAIADEIVPEVTQLAAGSPIDASLTQISGLTRAVNENEFTWRQRSAHTMQALTNVESAAIPFADSTPITYLPVQQWQDLTNQRDKFKAVDVHKTGTAEQRIEGELHKTTNLDVVEMPLKEVVTYLAELHDIPIVLALKKLDEAGISPDTPITKTLRGVTLRSALRLLLKDLELTYLVQDEVIQITTPEDAGTQLATKVYPVGDLVVPVQPPPNMFTPGGMNGINGTSGGPGMQNGPLNAGNPLMPQMNGPRNGMPPGGNIF